MPSSLKVASRASPLAKAQVEEVLLSLKNLGYTLKFQPLFLETFGDKDLLTRLRDVKETDFFTREVDEAVLSGASDIAIHSAKDLPDPLAGGLEILAITQGVDPSDALVFRENDTLASLNTGARIGVSCERREKAVLALRSDLCCIDVRGAIDRRLNLLFSHEIDGLVVAEAALIRLKRTHLNRIPLKGDTHPLQGKLAIIGKKDNEALKELFALLDTRVVP